MTNHPADKAFLAMERDGEIYAAFARVGISLVLFYFVWVASTPDMASHPLRITAVLYTIVSFAGVLFAFPRLFHPVTSYIFVAIDMGVIAFSLTMLAIMHHLTLTHEISIPLFSLSFVILIHSAIRYRPALIMFGFVIFTIQLLLYPAIFNSEFMLQQRKQSSSHSYGEGFFDLFLHDVGFLPLLFLFFSACLLSFIVMRTHRLARLAILDGQKAARLSRFFSPAISERLTSQITTQNTTGQRQNVAIAFVDICGFSMLSEKLSPEQVANLLSNYRSRVCEIVFQHNGSVDKFIGDGVMAVFGSPVQSEDDAKQAVEACLQIHTEINEANWLSQACCLPEVKVRIGAHYGDVFSGIIESGEILEHTVIGSVVNVAERLERLTREIDANFIFSDDLLRNAGQVDSLPSLSTKESVKVRGHQTPLKVWYHPVKNQLVSHDLSSPRKLETTLSS